ncbi:Cyclin-dependent kinase 14 [Acipenser ruthenus]|uniref:Cyclin-dependent kinase 14 n=1 Tax=Acipenser ruthenus TaxID=7906 RepID=A0A662YVI4_ACIRT|nr:Cyclin-dependent kinase 14 [Acipenser ruthenus]
MLAKHWRLLLATHMQLGYVNHAEELATRFLQCFPKNRLSALAAMNHEYFSDLPPRLWELSDSIPVVILPDCIPKCEPIRYKRVPEGTVHPFRR